jgi:hypothetical protein
LFGHDDRTKDDPFEIRHVVPFAWDESRGSNAPHFVAHPIPEKRCVMPFTITIITSEASA